MTTQTKPKFNPGTGSFSEKNSKGNKAFTMNSASWLTLQTYFNNTAALPDSLAALKTNMGPGAPTKMDDFEKLVAVYAKMVKQGSNFTGTLFPSIVDLADSVYHYAEAVPEYYGGLQQLISMYSAKPAPTGAALTTIQSDLIAVLDQLANNIKPFIKKANTVKNELNTTVTDLTEYLTTLGSNTPAPKGSGYWQYYAAKYGADCHQFQHIVQEIAINSNELHHYQSEYSHDVVVAETSPTYVWFFPFGTIAAGITAGIYGAKAIKAKHSIEATQSIISNLNHQKQAAMHLMQDLNLVTTQIQQVNEEGKAAVAIIEGMEGNWSAIASDLSNLSTLLKNDFNGTVGFLLGLDFKIAINDWKKLQQEVDVYRTNAFITVSK